MSLLLFSVETDDEEESDEGEEDYIKYVKQAEKGECMLCIVLSVVICGACIRTVLVTCNFLNPLAPYEENDISSNRRLMMKEMLATQGGVEGYLEELSKKYGGEDNIALVLCLCSVSLYISVPPDRKCVQCVCCSVGSHCVV